MKHSTIQTICHHVKTLCCWLNPRWFINLDILDWFWVFGQSTQGNTVVAIWIMQNFINLLKFCIIQSSIKIKIINNFFRVPWFGFFRALGTFVPKLPALVTSDWKKKKKIKNKQEMFSVRKKRHLWKLDRNEHFCNPRKFELSAAGCS